MENTSSKTYFASWDSALNPVKPEELWGKLGAFTTMKLEIKGRHRCAFFREKHIERLYESLRILNIQIPFPHRWIDSTVLASIKSIKQQATYRLRLMATAEYFTIVITLVPEPEMHLQGKIWSYERFQPEAKSLNYEDILDRLAETDRSREEIILKSSDGRLLEGATSNLLFVQGNQIITPARGRLNGVTLRLLKDAMANSIGQYNEILCCGSGRGVSAFIGIEDLGWNLKSLDAFRSVRMRYDNACIDYKYENEG
jgi:branched-subunit amino acid aminotransferase/4-amino-4-deoxychorismate lyase